MSAPSDRPTDHKQTADPEIILLPGSTLDHDPRDSPVQLAIWQKLHLPPNTVKGLPTVGSDEDPATAMLLGFSPPPP